MANNIEEKLELVHMPAESKENHESNDTEIHRSARAATPAQQVDENGQDRTTVTSHSVSSEQSTSTSVQMPMIKNIEVKLELPMPSKPDTDPRNNKFDPPKSATAPISVEIIDETGSTEGLSDTPHTISPQHTPSTSFQMPNEGKIFLRFRNSYT